MICGTSSSPIFFIVDNLLPVQDNLLAGPVDGGPTVGGGEDDCSTMNIMKF